MTVLHTMDHLESTTLTDVKAPCGWHPWSVETHSSRYHSSVDYMPSACEAGFIC
jgi:hypothetical protein